MLNNLRFTWAKLSPLFPRPYSSTSRSPVAIFWDLKSKHPNTIPLYDAAFRLRLAASSIGPVKFSIAYANSHAFRYVPTPASVLALRNRRCSPDRREDPKTLPSNTSYLCRVCGRNFYRHSSLLNHFTIHQREQTKRLNRINSARGGRKVKLAAKLSQKVEKYKKVAGEILVPEAGHGLADELKRADVKLRMVDDKPALADRALRDHMMEEMDKGRIGCFVLVSDDAGFVPVVREARMRCLRTVVVGNEMEGALRRCADTGFSWKEVIMGKARKEAGSAVVKWEDKDLLKRLEWTYRPDEEEESGWEESDVDENEECLGLTQKCDPEPWWKLDGNSEDSVVGSSSCDF